MRENATKTLEEYMCLTRASNSDPKEFFEELDENKIHENADPDDIVKRLSKIAGMNTMILSGRFGECVAKAIDDGTIPHRNYILFEGGVRKKSDDPEVLRKNCKFREVHTATLVDDTIYGSATYDVLNRYLHRYKGISINKIAVIYDGWPDRRAVKSLYHYTNFFS